MPRAGPHHGRSHHRVASAALLPALALLGGCGMPIDGGALWHEATDRARQHFTGFAPSSPSIGLLRDGKLLYMVERRDIEMRSAEGIADLLTLAFDKYCAPEAAPAH